MRISAPPLQGVKVLEIAGLGPAPLAALMLAELGATVIRIEPPAAKGQLVRLDDQRNLDRHGRHLLTLDLKNSDAIAAFYSLAAKADILIEGMRPGVMERLGLGPEQLNPRNPRLIYGRMTGFGQDGPLAARAGHDLTYLAYTGVLGAIGRSGEKPAIPLNLIGDYGGGTMFLLVGLLSALFERERSGKGQVVDAAMVDGVSMLAATLMSFISQGLWTDRRGENLLDGGAPFYDVYETSDGGHVAAACLEPQFFAEFARLLPLPDSYIARQYDRAAWPQMRRDIAEAFKTRTRDEWADHFGETDACVAPVLDFAEAQAHPHNRARGLYVQGGGFARPAPAPRLMRSAQTLAGAPRPVDHDTLVAFGLDREKAAILAGASFN